MGSERTSTARSRELGEELRATRGSAGLKSGEVATSLEWSTAKLSKPEAGVRGTTAWEVAALLQSDDYARADPASLLRRQLLFGRISAVSYLPEAALSLAVGGSAEWFA